MPLRSGTLYGVPARPPRLGWPPSRVYARAACRRVARAPKRRRMQYGATRGELHVRRRPGVPVADHAGGASRPVTLRRA